uniref:PPIase cyclophilin-type domain-containing protein n=1 Tax=Salix viminalis TaxID=40686 RepID=A0A6N2N8P4_SALVM
MEFSISSNPTLTETVTTFMNFLFHHHNPSIVLSSYLSEGCFDRRQRHLLKNVSSSLVKLVTQTIQEEKKNEKYTKSRCVFRHIHWRELAERIEIELLADQAPKTAQNFLALCADEGERLKHDAPYLLTTASDYHKYTIGSRFFITSNELHELDGKHVVFGRVVRKLNRYKHFLMEGPNVLSSSQHLGSLIDSSLPSEGRHSRKRKSKGLRVVEHYYESRHDQNQRGHSNQSYSRHYHRKSREKTSPGWYSLFSTLTGAIKCKKVSDFWLVHKFHNENPNYLNLKTNVVVTS